MEEKRFRNYEGADQLELFPTERQDKWAFRVAAFVIVLSVAALLGTAVWAGEPEGYYGQGHSLYHKKYQQMHNQLGTHCCHEGDCRPTTAKWDNDRKLWVAKVDGIWREIAADRHVQDAYGLNEFASVCARQDGYIYCFIPPNSGY